MAHAVVWTPQTFFYPIGNTPATSLAEYLSPDEDAAILVLGCGDPRNTLYTVASDSKNPFNRSLDFTFCDNEPPVLARNIFIYTLLFDQCDDETLQCLWKISFDIFVDEASFNLIVSHCKRLLKLSNSLDEWKSGPYGHAVKFCTKDTLDVVRGYWNLYLFNGRNPTAMKAGVLREMAKVAKSVRARGTVVAGLRSAGIMSMKMSTFGSEHFEHYWKHGVTGTEPAEISSADRVNPTLFYSSAGAKFNVHYGTDPIMCFHLAPALAPMQDIQGTPVRDLAGMITVIKSQFYAWGRIFHNRMTSANPKVHLRFFVGNAMTLCKALRYVTQTGFLDTPEYTKAWGGSTISFVEDYLPTSSTRPPVAFNVIETSNLADHLGFLNVLLITAPLLMRNATSALFTHSLLAFKEQGRHISALQKIGVEVPLLSLLFGLVPERKAFQTTSQSTQEVMTSAVIGEFRQVFEFNRWRVSVPEAPSEGYAFACDATELGNALFSAYLAMFQHEGLAAPLLAMKGPDGLNHYIRETFIELLRFVKDAYTGDWNTVATRIVELVVRDTTLIVGMNHYQDLCRGLQQAGLCDIVPNPTSFASAPRDFCFQGWEDIPKFICVVLVVPRANIQRLLDDSAKPSTPTLQCEVKLVSGHSIFTAFQCVFGTIERSSGPGNATKAVIIHEDPDGWQGKSDLILHFLAPAWLFVQRPSSEIQISFNMFGVSAVKQFRSKLGMGLSIYSTTLKDKKRAFIVRDRPRVASQTVSQDGSPGLSHDLAAQRRTPLMQGIVSRQPVSLKFQGTRVASFTVRCSIADDAAKATLSDKSTQVEAKAISIAAVRISFKGFETVVYFPYPVNGSALVTRIARKSSYIEIEARVAQSPKVPVELNPFPVVLTPNGPRQLSMHHLTLEHLPAFRSPFPNSDNRLSTWLNPHFLLPMGGEKKAVQALGKPSGLLDMQESVVHLFVNFLDRFKGKPALINLADPENGGVYTMVFVNCVRVDLTAHTIVVDGCVLPITIALLSRKPVQKAIQDLHFGSSSPELNVQIKTPAYEVPWWKAFLPTVVERCRTWSHDSNKCEYKTEGRIPRSLKMEEDPLCGCGRGKNLGKFEEVEAWKSFRPYVTRVAIGFPFPTSDQGDTTAELMKGMRDAEERPTGKMDLCQRESSIALRGVRKRIGKRTRVLVIFFYPIGNTSATSLAEYLPPDEDGAILVLGCGDPRSTLYTTDSDSKNPFKRALDFTFCDSEPPVLARNIFIYTLLFDQCDDETLQCLWKIYFDIFVDKASFNLIVSHCKRLLQLSNSLEEWKSGPYGHAIKFCTKDTLDVVRRYWNLYLFNGKNPTAMKAGVLREMAKVAKSVDGIILTAMRSAGIMSTKMTTFGPEHFKHYWKHGVTSTEPAEISSADRVNPTLFYSSAGDKFNVHYGTDPIMCFHLAPALAPMQDIEGTPVQDMADMITVIKSQFYAWGRTFHNKMTSANPKVCLRFFAGNAMTLCKALRYVAQTGYLDTPEYTTTWGGSTISLVDDYLPTSSTRPPVTFNVIETSNLADHLGFLNLLLITAPLLKRGATSVLFTHSLLASKEKGRHISALQKIGVEVPLLSLLFGLVPERAASQTTSQSAQEAMIAALISQSPQVHEFNCWRVSAPEVPGQGYAFACDATELGNALFSAYLQMFQDEGIAGSARAFKGPDGLKHYIRDTFVELLRFVKDAYTGDWDSAADRLVGLIERDTTLMVGMNNYQDLCRGLEQAGLYEIVPDPTSFASAPRDFCFHDWEDIPKVVCVVLVVPRANIQRLLDDSVTPSTPTLQCEVKLVNGHSVFTAFQPVFGTIEGPHSASTATKTVVIHEDPDGWQGKSDLIVHFLAPAWLFVQHPSREIKVGLNMFGTSAMLQFMSKLGFERVVHFPYPVDGSTLVTRIARKSSYIDVEGRVAQSPKVPVELNPFPVILTPNGPRQLSMHHLTLEHLPAFRSPFPNSDNSLSTWLNPHFLLPMAGEKKAAQALGKPSGLLDMQESVVHLFVNFLDKFKGKPALINLADPENGGVYTMFFVNCVRVDLTAHTIVVDGCVLPITIALLSRKPIQKAIQDLHFSSSSPELNVQIKTPAYEVPWWKAFLPTVVERCRTWSHDSDKCEYKTEGRIPRSLKMEEDPLCGCGRGKNLGKFEEVEAWKSFRPYVTRVAIGFPFPTSDQGDTTAELMKGMRDAEERPTGKTELCQRCGKPGKPKLLICSRCKGVKYCSAGCQKADWKAHKGACGK
ncbi:hypothetical protein MD484_g2895, partial [Candolleomyces efflorescens]